MLLRVFEGIHDPELTTLDSFHGLFEPYLLN